MAEKIRWGILGTGNIARKFAEGLKLLNDAKLLAVGSRNKRSAETFGNRYNVSHRHASYAALASDAEVDVIYIATPNSLHRENTILCLKAGKHVLCEKPFAINAREAGEMIRCARERKLFLMEAMWTRFLPLIVKVQDFIKKGAIGKPMILTADFGFKAKFDPQSRVFNPLLGGGALLDVGIYPVSFSSLIFGNPSAINGLAHIGDTGVDEYSTMSFKFERDQLAILYASVRTNTSQEAIIIGDEGQIRIHSPWWHAKKMTLTVFGKDETIVELPYEGNGYHLEANEVMHCIRKGETESQTMSLDETLSIMQTMDVLRAQWGLKFPME